MKITVKYSIPKEQEEFESSYFNYKWRNVTIRILEYVEKELEKTEEINGKKLVSKIKAIMKEERLS